MKQTTEGEEKSRAGETGQAWPDRYVLGDAIRRAWAKHGLDSWCSVADDVIAELATPQSTERCAAHCGHDISHMKNGLCTFLMGGETHPRSQCRHVCDFSQPVSEAAKRAARAVFGTGNTLELSRVPSPIGGENTVEVVRFLEESELASIIESELTKE